MQASMPGLPPGETGETTQYTADTAGRTEKKQRLFFLLALLYLLGVVLGSVCFAEAGSVVSGSLLSGHSAVGESAIFSIIVASLASSFFFGMCIFLFGLSLWGSFLTPLLLLLQGIGFGVFAGYCCRHGAAGLLHHLLILLPGTIPTALSMLWMTKESICFSSQLRLLHRSTRKGKPVKPPSVLQYGTRCGVQFLAAILGAVLDGVTRFLFPGL